MNDLTPNDLSHMSDEDFNALCPQGHHAPGAEPLSHAAQAVRRDFAQIMQELNQRCRVSISATDTLPITLETNNALLEAGINSLCAAALRAAVTATQSRQYEGCWICRASDILAIAAELEGQ